LDLYREAATAVGVAAWGQEMRSSQLIDGKVWDGSDPAGYARGFKLHAMSDSSPLLASR
ncbi:MAG: nitrate ABC transporter substrate-binding protein, partial [Pseudomonas sp.]